MIIYRLEDHYLLQQSCHQDWFEAGALQHSCCTLWLLEPTIVVYGEVPSQAEGQFRHRKCILL
jgi:hypothetical protein